MRLENRLAVIGTLRVLGFSITTPFVGVALAEIFRLQLTEVSAFYAVLAAAGALGQLLGGALSDRAGRVKVMLAGSAAASASLLLAAAIYNASSVMVGVAAQGLFSGAYSVASMTLVGDWFSSREHLVRAYGRLRVGSNAGWALGAALGGYLYYTLGFREAMVATSAIQISSAALVLGLREPPVRLRGKPLRRPNRALAAIMVPTFLTFMIAGLMGYPLIQYTTEYMGLSAAYAGLLLATNGALVVALQDLIASKTSRLRPEVPLAAGMAVYALGYGLLPAIRGFWETMLDVALITTGEMTVMPVSSALVALLSNPSSRGSHMGFYGLVSSLGRTLSSSVFALALSLSGPRDAWALEVLIAMSSSALYMALVPSAV